MSHKLFKFVTRLNLLQMTKAMLQIDTRVTFFPFKNAATTVLFVLYLKQLSRL